MSWKGQQQVWRVKNEYDNYEIGRRATGEMATATPPRDLEFSGKKGKGGKWNKSARDGWAANGRESNVWHDGSTARPNDWAMEQPVWEAWGQWGSNWDGCGHWGNAEDEAKRAPRSPQWPGSSAWHGFQDWPQDSTGWQESRSSSWQMRGNNARSGRQDPTEDTDGNEDSKKCPPIEDNNTWGDFLNKEKIWSSAREGDEREPAAVETGYGCADAEAHAGIVSGYGNYEGGSNRIATRPDVDVEREYVPHYAGWNSENWDAWKSGEEHGRSIAKDLFADSPPQQGAGFDFHPHEVGNARRLNVRDLFGNNETTENATPSLQADKSTPCSVPATIQNNGIDGCAKEESATRLTNVAKKEPNEVQPVVLKAEVQKVEEPSTENVEQMPKNTVQKQTMPREKEDAPKPLEQSGRQGIAGLLRRQAETRAAAIGEQGPSTKDDKERERESSSTNIDIIRTDTTTTKETGNEESDDEWLDDQNAWTEYVVSPLAVRFSQACIHPFFYRRGPVISVLNKIVHAPPQTSLNPWHRHELVLTPPFAPIRVLSATPPDCREENDAEMWTLDNRRLYALQVAALQRWPSRCVTKILVTDHIPRKKFKTNYRKFKTKTRGRSVDVVAKYQRFDEWDWFNTAMEKELPGLQQHVGTVMHFFQTLPIVCIFFFYIYKSEDDSDKLMRAIMFLVMAFFFLLDHFRRKDCQVDVYFAERHVRALLDGHSITGPRWVPLLPKHRQGTQPYICYLLAVLLFGSIPYIFVFTNRGRVRSIAVSIWFGLASIVIRCLIVAKGRLKDTMGAKFPNIKSTPKYNVVEIDVPMIEEDAAGDEVDIPSDNPTGSNLPNKLVDDKIEGTANSAEDHSGRETSGSTLHERTAAQSDTSVLCGAVTQLQ
eukprot:GEMP01006037.1.p1 GENE.GEMP01006037.1~~GEMP01006037.1.p1  ORF type:complete len:883 (-),score=191.66 GEMP01006037.1:415-3063(-)